MSQVTLPSLFELDPSSFWREIPDHPGYYVTYYGHITRGYLHEAEYLKLTCGRRGTTCVIEGETVDVTALVKELYGVNRPKEGYDKPPRKKAEPKPKPKKRSKPRPKGGRRAHRRVFCETCGVEFEQIKLCADAHNGSRGGLMNTFYSKDSDRILYKGHWMVRGPLERIEK